MRCNLNYKFIHIRNAIVLLLTSRPTSITASEAVGESSKLHLFHVLYTSPAGLHAEYTGSTLGQGPVRFLYLSSCMQPVRNPVTFWDCFVIYRRSLLVMTMHSYKG